MLKKSKKIIFVFAIMFIFTQLSSVMAVDINVPQGKPTLDGILEPGEWDENSKYVMDKADILKYNGIFPDTDSMTDDRGVVTYLLWDDAGLYIAVDVKDNTPTFTASWDAHGQDSGVKSDMYQVVLWAHDEGKWMDMAIYKDGKFAPRGHEDFDNPEDNNLEGKMIGQGTVKTDGSGYYIECFMPWDVVYVKADYKAETKIPVMFMYVDMDGEDQVFYKTVDVDVWPPSADVDNYLILSAATHNAPAAAEPEQPAEEPQPDIPVADTPAVAVVDAPEPVVVPATGSETMLMSVCAFIAICGAAVIFKKRNV